MYKWQQVKALRAKGVSIKKIARELKLSKNTVRKYLRSSEPPQFKPRQYEKMLNGYEDKVKEMLEKKYIGTRIYSELIKIGYEGSLSTVHRYIREAKREEERSEKITTRFETAPGRQMQYDWKGWEPPVDGKRLRVYIHEVVLSYSRKKYYTYSLSITTSDVIRAIEEAIHFFGGVAPECVIDNPKQMVITHESNGIVRYNDEFLRFCGIYGIDPNLCQVEELMLSQRDGSLMERLMAYSRLHLLIIDELGYMPITRQQANLLFQLISIRYEKGFIILTSNYNFDEWGRIFEDNVVATAIIDRLVHHASIFYINGSSYRVKNKLKKG